MSRRQQILTNAVEHRPRLPRSTKVYATLINAKRDRSDPVAKNWLVRPTLWVGFRDTITSFESHCFESNPACRNSTLTFYQKHYSLY
jgi:hypothetical protein